MTTGIASSGPGPTRHKIANALAAGESSCIWSEMGSDLPVSRAPQNRPIPLGSPRSYVLPAMAHRSQVRQAMRFEAILEWFSGKAKDTIVNFTIPAIVESEELGYWKKGVARTVRASLNKQNVAKKLARDIDEHLGESRQFGDSRNRLRSDHPLWDCAFAMEFGQFEKASRLLAADAQEKRNSQGDFTIHLKTGPVNVNKAIDRWAHAFVEVAALIDLLDSRRPKPVYVMKTLSPTVAQNLSAHIGIDISTLAVPDSHGEYVEMEIKGKKRSVYMVVIDWPEGTLHYRSKFLYSKNTNSLCQACGHAIKDPYNWVPILAYGTDGKTPYSLWVGRDCASKLFSCEVEGDAIYQR